MKEIDILNKIANGKIKEGFKIKRNNYIYELKSIDDNYFRRIDDDMYIYSLGDFTSLNNEVEVLEEDKKIEKITMRAGMVGSIDNKLESLNINIMAVEDKINEIIDYLEENK